MDKDLFELLKFLDKKARTPLKPESDDLESRENFDRQVNMLLWLRDYGYIDLRDGCIRKDNGTSGFRYLGVIVDGLKYPGIKAISYGTYEKYYEAEVRGSAMTAFIDQSININGSINQSTIAVKSDKINQSVTCGPADDIFQKLLETIIETKADSEVVNKLSAAVEEMRDSYGNGTNDYSKHYLTFTSILADHMQIFDQVAPYLTLLAQMLVPPA
jgi:hypothetical protein